MYFSKIAVLFALAATGLSAPIEGAEKRQAKLLSVQDYSQFQVSDGTAGNALAEVAQKFPVAQIKADLAGVSKDDLAILQAARVAAEGAETDAGGFNDAIAKASGADADALKVGKIKNKVLKLQLEVLALQVQQAQGASNQAKIDAEQKKLDNNVKTDTASKGKTSQSVSFSATSAPKGKKN
ncbi:hypothetical protein CABS01_16095 [Colletotrichum abscissum]|uniref:Small secreted protein n=1 Tax=Colletotrichum abscissum TaxID=1671311 RepID=A0A9P9X1E6_9PEZI|nr:uncharacterized protein CABS01_16095 [Colletotrichum abscissum]KAI3531116.1 hypothetical protein CABS02_14293 [Colletotrichum abscissum]KAK1472952.1 hypothetical protein CABS01_16095 [Colletotrichum abscissum]